MPPATPKLALSPDGVPVIQPPPVTKSHGGISPGAGGELVTNPHMTPIVDAPKTTFTPANASMTCRALTVMTPAPAICSFRITKPPSERNTIWFAASVTATAWPLMASAWTWLCPLTPNAAQTAATCDITKSAVMVVAPDRKPAAVRLTSATAASAEAAFPPAITAA